MKLSEFLSRMSTSRAMMLGLAIAAVYYFLVFDNGATQRSAMEQTQSRITELQTQIQENQRKLDRAKIYKTTVSEVGETINRLTSLIPEKFGMPDLMRIVSNEVKVAGSSLVDLKPATTEISPVAKEFEEISINVDLSGSFLQHMVFLSNLTKMKQILIVRKFDFNIVKEARSDELPIVKMVAEIVAYRYRGSAAKGAPGSGMAPPPPPEGTGR